MHFQVMELLKLYELQALVDIIGCASSLMEEAHTIFAAGISNKVEFEATINFNPVHDHGKRRGATVQSNLPRGRDTHSISHFLG